MDGPFIERQEKSRAEGVHLHKNEKCKKQKKEKQIFLLKLSTSGRIGWRNVDRRLVLGPEFRPEVEAAVERERSRRLLMRRIFRRPQHRVVVVVRIQFFSSAASASAGATAAVPCRHHRAAHFAELTPSRPPEPVTTKVRAKTTMCYVTGLDGRTDGRPSNLLAAH